MNFTTTYLLLTILAFLLGSLPFGLWAGKMKGVDVRKAGSGNIGFTNVWRLCGKTPGIFTLAGDVLKGVLASGALPLVLAMIAGGGTGAEGAGGGAAGAAAGIAAGAGMAGAAAGAGMADAAAGAAGAGGYAAGLDFWRQQSGLLFGLASILGHCFTPFAGFRGGKGVATSLGCFLTLAPGPIAVAFVVFVSLVAATRYISLGSVIAAAVLPILVAWREGLTPLFAVSALIGALIILRHRGNIKRLLDGTERKFEWRTKS